jgi:pimeloyl-ACP methyl ester carboxylesterase
MTPPPGRLVDVGTHRLHIYCAGTGEPAVIFDAALGASSLSWSLVQPEVARETRACTYDRAGFAWSDAGPLPRTAGRLAAELHELLVRAAVPPPYVLVGHSFGGLVMQGFAVRYRAETAGLVLVDPAHPEEWAHPSPGERQRIARGVRLCRYGAAAARVGLARVISGLVGLGALSPARALVRLISRGGLRREDEVILAPVSMLPPAARRPLRHFWTQPKFYEALGSQIEGICESAADVMAARAAGFGDLPLITISPRSVAGARLLRQDALARLSTKGRHLKARTDGHWVPLEDPRVVIEAVTAVVTAARTAQASRLESSAER